MNVVIVHSFPAQRGTCEPTNGNGMFSVLRFDGIGDISQTEFRELF